MKQQFAAQLPWKLLWNNGDIALLSINTLSLTTYISLAKLDPFKHAVGYKIKRKKSKFIFISIQIQRKVDFQSFICKKVSGFCLKLT